MKKVLTATDIAAARKAGQTSLAVPAGAIITPQAADDAREFGIALVREGTAPAASAQRGVPAQPGTAYSRHAMPVPVAPLPLNVVQGSPAMPRILTQNIPQGAPPVAAQAYARYAAPAAAPVFPSVPAPVHTGQDAAFAEEVRRQVLARAGNVAPAAVDAAISAVLSGAGSGASFTGQARNAYPAQGSGSASPVVHASAAALPAANVASAPSAVSMVEVAAPGAALPGLGYMSWENSSFTWTFEHAAALVVLEGQLALTANGASVAANPGDSLLIPAGVAVTVSATGRVRCVHSSWPNPETRKG